MRVWTVQPLTVWERLTEAGTLRVDTACYPYDGYVPWQYPWMACRLQERAPDYQGGLPWWAYCERPDLRWVRRRRPAGQPQVRIELDVNGVLVFPSWAWDVVYCGNFLSFTQSEQETWNAAMRRAVPDEDLWPLPEPWRAELEASWLRLFDPQLPSDGWADILGKSNSSSRANEAVFETLRLQDVRRVTHFVGTSRWPHG